MLDIYVFFSEHSIKNKHSIQFDLPKQLKKVQKSQKLNDDEIIIEFHKTTLIVIDHIFHKCSCLAGVHFYINHDIN